MPDCLSGSIFPLLRGSTFDHVSLNDIQSNHRDISNNIVEKIQPLPAFNRYLRNGYLPIIAEGEAEYLPKLEQVINAIVDTDLAYIASYNAGTAVKVKRLFVTSPVEGDFLISNLTIEVGGKSKTSKQVKDTENYLVVADDIEMGFGSKVPLWLLGFLY